METLKNFWKVLKNRLWIWIILLLGLIAFALLLISEEEFPNLHLSTGIVALISAVIGVVLTAFAISVQLKQQSEAEAQKDKNVKIYEKKIAAYSKFSSKMWNFFNEYDKIEGKDIEVDNYEKLRIMCFDELAFFLEKKDIEKLAKIIGNLKSGGLNVNYSCICEITDILQDSLQDKKKEKKSIKQKKLEKEKKDLLINLYNSFDNLYEPIEQKDKTEQISTTKEDGVGITSNEMTIPVNETNITFWHFNIWGDEQIKAFEKGNWVLNAIEYGEDWRTWKIKNQVKEGDVVFLFRRGGFGYVGAFRVVSRDIGENEKSHCKILEEGKKHTPEDILKYDIYNSLEDGATFSSNIFVEPIAYNYKGIRYLTVRRRTIEKFVNDSGTVNVYLERFKGKGDIPEDRKIVGNKLDETTEVKITPENQEFLNNLKG